MLSPAQFDLRAWDFGPPEEEKTIFFLGLVWNTKRDTLSLDIDCELKEKFRKEPTLRHILSLVHSLFDPLVFASPFVMVENLLLRQCCDAKVGLDTTFGKEIPRHVIMSKNAVSVLSVIRPLWPQLQLSSCE